VLVRLEHRIDILNHGWVGVVEEEQEDHQIARVEAAGVEEEHCC
jgi:hypothetical protein